MGTIEVRICDAVTRVEDAVAIAAYCQALVKALSDRYDAGEEIPSYHRILTSENKWLAARYGLDAPVMDLATGRRIRIPIAKLVRRTLRELEPHARELGSERELEGIAALLARGNSAERQLRVFNANRDIVDPSPPNAVYPSVPEELPPAARRSCTQIEYRPVCARLNIERLAHAVLESRPADTAASRTRTQSGAGCSSGGARPFRAFRARRQLKAGDAVVLQDRHVDVRDLLVRDEDESFVTRRKPRSRLDGPQLEDVQSVSRERHDLDAQNCVALVAGVAVVPAELLNRLEEAPAEEEVRVEHATASGGGSGACWGQRAPRAAPTPAPSSSRSAL